MGAGKCRPDRNNEHGYSLYLNSDVQTVLRDIHVVIGYIQVTIKRLHMEPYWITHTVVEGHENNWAGAYQEEEEKSIPGSVNVSWSHVVFKIKTGESGERRLDARLCPHGNKDQMKGDVRKDSATDQLYVIRLIMTMAKFFPVRIGVVDISGT